MPPAVDAAAAAAAVGVSGGSQAACCCCGGCCWLREKEEEKRSGALAAAVASWRARWPRRSSVWPPVLVRLATRPIKEEEEEECWMGGAGASANASAGMGACTAPPLLLDATANAASAPTSMPPCGGRARCAMERAWR